MVGWGEGVLDHEGLSANHQIDPSPPPFDKGIGGRHAEMHAYTTCLRNVCAWITQFKPPNICRTNSVIVGYVFHLAHGKVTGANEHPNDPQDMLHLYRLQEYALLVTDMYTSGNQSTTLTLLQHYSSLRITAQSSFPCNVCVFRRQLIVWGAAIIEFWGTRFEVMQVQTCACATFKVNRHAMRST
ncbi:hypothetical protein BC939DRAFT_474368 [Gamsiella multidivaricata]|uniref:uncharacterized protein n=1 Tax=Gamsiella multidivaricata TaxID=101098 RepID=UPI002220AC66|nr:uncharacterized protein BC939DRAFT_474368 [Gamsiella multidivaricata]KAI7829464.1 hypothetical protein BC939DRAFT_474368 [Gamsiella multidivaricata]